MPNGVMHGDWVVTACQRGHLAEVKHPTEHFTAARLTRLAFSIRESCVGRAPASSAWGAPLRSSLLMLGAMAWMRPLCG
jgi:hypothetical protein